LQATSPEDSLSHIPNREETRNSVTQRSEYGSSTDASTDSDLDGEVTRNPLDLPPIAQRIGRVGGGQTSLPASLTDTAKAQAAINAASIRPRKSTTEIPSLETGSSSSSSSSNKNDRPPSRLGKIGRTHNRQDQCTSQSPNMLPQLRHLPTRNTNSDSSFQDQSIAYLAVPDTTLDVSGNRADQNRAELKRELEEKKKHPTKKKRKF
jgi:hypothetical protein